MPSARDIYNQQKAAAEQQAREAEARRRVEEQRDKAYWKALADKDAKEEARARALEAERDKVAKEYLQKTVLGELKDLKKSAGGFVEWGGNREIALVTSSEVVVRNAHGLGNPNNPAQEVTRGVSVGISFDENNLGHLVVNGEIVDPSSLPQALANAALRPTTLGCKTIVEEPSHGHDAIH